MQAEHPYQIKTDIFEGPMDLLVHLIKKNAVSIYDIPIAAITKQFLDYIEWMKMLNIDFAGDFLYMAAILTSIKSRTLLPSHGGPDDDDDPRLEITHALEEYLKIKSAADDLSAREILNEDTFTRAAEKKAAVLDGDDHEMISVGLFELIDAFQNILDRVPASSRLRFSADEISVKDKISEIVDILEGRRSVTFYELFAEDAGKSEIVATFLAILEMVKLNLVELKQHTQSGMIRLFYR